MQGFYNHGFADDKIRIASIDTASRKSAGRSLTRGSRAHAGRPRPLLM